MAKLITKDLAVCGDCLAYIANGTTEDADLAICAKGATGDCCRREQGGNRYMAGILV